MGAPGMSEPHRNRCSLVRREIVEHDVDVEFFRHVRVNELEEVEDLFARVTGPDVVEDLASHHVHRREQVGCAVSFVVVGHGGAPASLHGQTRLGPIERLNLGLFIKTEDHGPFRRVHVEPHHADQLLLKVRIG